MHHKRACVSSPLPAAHKPCSARRGTRPARIGWSAAAAMHAAHSMKRIAWIACLLAAIALPSKAQHPVVAEPGSAPSPADDARSTLSTKVRGPCSATSLRWSSTPDSVPLVSPRRAAAAVIARRRARARVVVVATSASCSRSSRTCWTRTTRSGPQRANAARPTSSSKTAAVLHGA